jgi:hypothetical protein
VQDADDRDRHHPPGLIRAALAAAVALVLAGSAAAAHYGALPSPTAPLTPQPPLGPATASAEGVRHRISSSTTVRVSVDAAGAPFAVTATQRLDVRVTGDYFFTIGAPVLGVSAAAGSQSRPGFRTGAIVWAGFDPSRRLLAATATLDPAEVSAALPLRLTVADGRTTLVNATSVTASAYSADALRAPLVAYLRQLQGALAHGRAPLSGGAELTSAPVATRATVLVPLAVTGTIGGQRIDLTLGRRAIVPRTGRIELHVRAAPVGALGVSGKATGRELLAFATKVSLTLARTRQYEQFLANPDPTGASESTFVYRTAARSPAVVVAAHRSTRSWRWVELVGVLTALAVGAVVWSRS